MVCKTLARAYKRSSCQALLNYKMLDFMWFAHAVSLLFARHCSVLHQDWWWLKGRNTGHWSSRRLQLCSKFKWHTHKALSHGKNTALDHSELDEDENGIALCFQMDPIYQNSTRSEEQSVKNTETMEIFNPFNPPISLVRLEAIRHSVRNQY